MKVFATVILLVMVVSAFADQPQRNILWEENFSRFDVGPAGGMGKKCVIKEENGKKYLHGTGWMLGKMAYHGSKKWADYSFRFRFRFTDPKKIGFYPIVKDGIHKDGVKYMWYYLQFTRDKLIFKCHGLEKKFMETYKLDPISYKAKGFAPLQAGIWYDMKIDVTREKIKIYLSNEDNLQELADVKAAPGIGGVQILSYSPVDLTDMVVEKLPIKTGDVK